MASNENVFPDIMVLSELSCRYASEYNPQQLYRDFSIRYEISSDDVNVPATGEARMLLCT